MSEGWLYRWKHIAEFIGCSVRTAKTYHYTYGMPLLRAPNGSVIGIPDIIMAWLIKFNDRCDTRRPRSLKKNRGESEPAPG